VIKSSYYQKMTQLAEDVDQFYKDLLEKDFSENAKKYYAMFISFLQKKTNLDELSKIVQGDNPDFISRTQVYKFILIVYNCFKMYSFTLRQILHKRQSANRGILEAFHESESGETISGFHQLLF